MTRVHRNVVCAEPSPPGHSILDLLAIQGSYPYALDGKENFPLEVKKFADAKGKASNLWQAVKPATYRLTTCGKFKTNWWYLVPRRRAWMSPTARKASSWKSASSSTQKRVSTQPWKPSDPAWHQTHNHR